MSEAFFHGLQVGSAGEQPGGVGVAQVVDPDPVGQSGSGEGGQPEVAAETSSARRADPDCQCQPSRWRLTSSVPSGGARDPLGVVVFAVGSSAGAVGGVGVAAVFAAARGHVVGGDGAAVPIGAPGRVRPAVNPRSATSGGLVTGRLVEHVDGEQQPSTGDVLVGEVGA